MIQNDDTESMSGAAAETAAEVSIPTTEIVAAAKKARKKPGKKKAKSEAPAKKKASKRPTVKKAKKPAKAKSKEAADKKPTARQKELAAKREKRAKALASGKKLRGPGGGDPVPRRGVAAVAKRIRAARLAKELTQSALAGKLGCGQPTIALWEGAISGVGGKYAAKLGKILGLSLKDLGRKDE